MKNPLQIEKNSNILAFLNFPLKTVTNLVSTSFNMELGDSTDEWNFKKFSCNSSSTCQKNSQILSF